MASQATKSCAESDEEVGLPDGWRCLTISDVVASAHAPRSLDKSQGVKTPFIPMSLLPQDGGVTSRWELRAPQDVRSGVPFAEGDVLLAKITPCLENGKLGLARGLPGGWGITSTEVYPLRPTKVTPEFLAGFLCQQVVRHGLASKMQGATGRQRLPKEAPDSFPIAVPPLPEQQAIAGVLRTVQAARDACERVIAATRQLKHSLLAHLFTYGPVPFDQAERVSLEDTPGGKVPAHWPIVPIGECAHVQTGIAKGRRLNGDEVISVPYLRVANVQSGRLDLSEMKEIELRRRELDRYLLQTGDIVLTEGGDFDKLGRGFIWRGEISPCVHQNHIFAVRADRSKLLPDFLAFFVQSDHARSYFLGVAHKTTNLACINKTKLEGLPVLLPPLSVQRQIATQLSAVDAKLAAEESRQNALAFLFASLLDSLMTGRVRLPEFAT